MSKDKANNLIRGGNKEDILNLDFNFPSLINANICKTPYQ